MSESCICNAKSVVLLPCSGGSNCGQIANDVAVELTKEGIGSIYCLSGIGAHIDGMIESARSADQLVVIDGCPVACAKKVVNHVGLKITHYIDVSEQGIEKNKNFDIPKEIIEAVATRIKSLIQGNENRACCPSSNDGGNTENSCGCGCC